MRINVYSQEITTHIRLVHKRSDTGVVYSAIRWFMHSPQELHHTECDDDRTAITVWLPRNPERRKELAKLYREMADLVECAPEETGADE